MQIVIDIPKELAEKEHWYTDEEMWAVIKAAQNGTVLPKHGRLGDLDYLYKKFEANGCKDSNVYRLIKDEPTILEATKESEK